VPAPTAEQQRLQQNDERKANWTRWGPYLAERQWGTVREDYSADGTCWEYLPHDHARSRVYRWGEDGLLGICDRECRLCFAIALWNGRDSILKERLFGLSGPEGNHGEDVKELYYFLAATPTASYLKALYKYAQAAFPYAELTTENGRRTRAEAEYEIEDTGIFDQQRYFDITVEYAKAGPDDIAIRITCDNRADEAADLHVLPTLWQRNTWGWGRGGEGYWPKGSIEPIGPGAFAIEHPGLGRYQLHYAAEGGELPRLLATENETNTARLFGVENATPYVKDAFHRHVVDGEQAAVNPEGRGSKVAGWYARRIAARGRLVVCQRFFAEATAPATVFGPDFDALFERRATEAEEFHLAVRDSPLDPAAREVVRQADAGLIWSRQFYHYIVQHWLEGDPSQPHPPPERRAGRNRKWSHLWARDVIMMPDSWEYPWFAAWDLAFHCVAAARTDPAFAKQQLLLLCREWYMHPNGQLPAYEFAFGDVNPPLLAWAARRIYELTAARGEPDVSFLERAFHKCLVNFTWWVNRHDTEGDNLFTGGFLGLDNIGIFDRSRGLPGGGRLEQADATAWMAFYCTTMQAMAFELARADPAYADIATKFFEHFVSIASAMNHLGGNGLWDEQDGFYYDQAYVRGGPPVPLRIRSLVGLIPLFTAETLDAATLQHLPKVRARLEWFLENQSELANSVSLLRADVSSTKRLLAIPNRERLLRVLAYVLDEREFLSPYGVRSLSKIHAERPYVLELEGETREVHYTPGESDTGLFGGNSNWRGPVWVPSNYLLCEALKRFHHFYGESLLVECPTGSGKLMNLRQVAREIERRLAALFLPDASGRRPCHGAQTRYKDDPHFRDLLLFHEYFHGDDGRGLGASHQTGWTALIANTLELVARAAKSGQ
jgi:hypothetical protein